MVTTVDIKDAGGATVTLNAPVALGRAAAAASKAVVLSSEDFAVIDNLETLITSTNTKLDTLHTDLGTTIHADLATTLAGYVDGLEAAIAALSQRWAFDVLVNPTVTNGAYSAGDIIGGLLTFTNVARATDELFVVTGALVTVKSAVTPSLTLVLFNADPNGAAYADNNAYGIVAADIGKELAALPVATLFDHGTPNTYRIDNQFIVCTPISGTRNVYGLLVDATGVTLTSTSDIGIRLRGIGI